MPGRYDKEASKEIRRIVRNYNRRVARLSKARVPYLPAKVSAKNLLENYDPTDLQRRLLELQSFTAKSARKKVRVKNGYTSEYNIKILEQRLPKAKSDLEEAIQNYGQMVPTVWGKRQQGTVASGNYDAYWSTLTSTLRMLNRSTISDYDAQTIRRRLQTTESIVYGHEASNRRLQENYTSTLRKLGDAYLSPKEQQELEEMIMALQNVDPAQFYIMFQNERMMPEIFDDSKLLRLLLEDATPDDMKKAGGAETPENLRNFMTYFNDIRREYGF